MLPLASLSTMYLSADWYWCFTGSDLWGGNCTAVGWSGQCAQPFAPPVPAGFASHSEFEPRLSRSKVQVRHRRLATLTTHRHDGGFHHILPCGSGTKPRRRISRCPHGLDCVRLQKDALVAGREAINQRSTVRACADDGDVEMAVHDGSWSGPRRQPYSSGVCSCEMQRIGVWRRRGCVNGVGQTNRALPWHDR